MSARRRAAAPDWVDERPWFGPCGYCGGEGEIEHGYGYEPWSYIEPCPHCRGHGVEEMATEAVTIDDLDAQDEARRVG